MTNRRWMFALMTASVALVACNRQSSTTGTSTAESPAAGTASPSECKQATGEQIALELRDFSFNPKCAAGTAQMGLSIKNNGDNLHNLSIEGFEGINVDISPGEENNTEATGLPAGTHVVFCKYHRTTNNMEGKLQIK